MLFATDQFTNFKTLANPIHDAQDLAETLTTIYGFETEIVQNPTYAEMRAKLSDYANQKTVHFGPADELLIFFAGHGKFDEMTREGYVVAKDSTKGDPPYPAFSHSELSRVLDHMPVAHLLLVLDVCFGGTFDALLADAEGDRGAEPGEMPREQLIQRSARYRSRLYLAAGGKEYVSDGIPGKNSPFTYALLDVLRKRGGADRVLTFDEIKAAIQRLEPMPRGGPFGSNAPGATFIFVAPMPR